MLAHYRLVAKGLSMAAVALAWAGTAEAAPACPPPIQGWERPAIVTLDTGKAQPVYRHDRTVNDLSVGVLRRQGLTNVQTQLQLSVEVEIVPVPPQSACYRLKTVKGRWQIINIEVFIAFEHQPGSCSYTATRDHENQHVAVAQTTYDAHLPVVTAALTSAANRVRPFQSVRDDGTITNNLVKQLQAELAPTLAAYEAEIKRRNGDLDTPGSYREVASRCKVWPK
ncbi:hypothetical protein [Magnetospirillum sp. LM-5]|uniref:hypothetical protein n=1 Tax=Magnetospirillum sp. LM-5 TaxID=2681466 RepID=UPI00156F0240|nr:hypothetical protein [Magnetospirillum sp. LM-5]